ncbi:cytosolic 5'-nucleotidase 3-like isoform X4 [Argonauta hians]
MDLIPHLKLNNAHFSDATKVNEILKKFIADGPDKLQIVTDFDQTLTMHTYQGKRCDSCHGVLDNSSFLPDDFRKKAAKLRETYAPIEFDPKIETELKIPKMEEWWGQVHSLLGSLNITRGLISEMVSQSSVRLRSGCNEFFKSLDQLNIPVLIISAGLGDILKEIIIQQSSIYNNMKIVSNFMKFNEDKMVGFENEIIHTFNKSKCEIHKSDYFRNQRSNVILMGDTLGDLDLAEGVPKHFTVIKVGYLNDRVEDSLELYKKEFDIVLVKTESVDLINSIIKTMVEKKGETKNKV